VQRGEAEEDRHEDLADERAAAGLDRRRRRAVAPGQDAGREQDSEAACG